MVAASPKLNTKMWSVSLYQIPYLLPANQIAWSGLGALSSLMIGVLLDTSLSYPAVFLIVGECKINFIFIIPL